MRSFIHKDVWTTLHLKRVSPYSFEEPPHYYYETQVRVEVHYYKQFPITVIENKTKQYNFHSS